MSNSESVLIVGAGPTGLMMANELERHQIPFRIIDKNPEQTQGSNATWIQARTLEIFDAMGIINQFLKIGHQCHALNFYENGKHLAKMSFNKIDCKYPFILMVPQRETERILNKKLAESQINVERSCELINIQQTGNGVVSTLKLSNGDTESVTSDWVIACDGANSVIREKCRMIVPVEEIPEQFMVADAKMNSFLPTDEIHMFFGKGTVFPEKATFFSAFPWDQQHYRLTTNLYHKIPRQTFYEHEVKEVVAERTYGNFIVDNTSWISPFWIHGRIVEKMQNNSIFLLGDAAHIHSPAGGQGMNLGLQDAYNLAWKLALIIKQKAKPVILESFQSERHPIAKDIVKRTNDLTNMMLFDKNFFHELHKFCESLAKKGKVQKYEKDIMQLSIAYKRSPIINYDVEPQKNSPQPGERAPDVEINEKPENLYHYFSEKHTILLFAGKDKKVSKDLLHFLKIAREKFSQIANVILISKETMDDKNRILDEHDLIHEKYHIKNTAIYIIRPDTYIGYFSEELDIKNLEDFFNVYLTGF